MAGDDINNDHYVANLLKEDAKNTAKQYKMVGLDAFLPPKRMQSGAPRPNTQFLRHIIRQTDNHNTALLAKEAEDSRARLKQMNRTKQDKKRDLGRLTPPRLDEEEGYYRKRRRSRSGHDGDEDRERHSKRRKDRDYNDHRGSRLREENRREKDRRRDSERYDESDESGRRRHMHPKHSRHKDKRYEYSSEEDKDRSRRKDISTRRHRRQRSYSTASFRSPSPARSRRHHRSSRHRYSSRSNSRSISPSVTKETRNSRRKRPSPGSGSDSDPLEAIVGPLPPRPQPTIRARGRGAQKANSMAMDARFSSTYNPTTDVHLNSDVEDDWGDALEALKDRQRWKQQGAERLKAAGFSDEQVKKWEKGDELTEEDVKWARKGEKREWDRGKIFDEVGDVRLKAEFGRLT